MQSAPCRYGDEMTVGSSPSVLVVDDEVSICDVVSSGLELAGCSVSRAESGTRALHLLRSRPVDLVVLDVMLPDRSGFEVVQILRAEGRTVPVLFLTARTDSASVIEGLTQGGDDYIRKPFDLGELVARVQSRLRGTDKHRTDTVVSFRDLVVDTGSVTARRDERALDLTPTEFRMLEILARHAGRVLTKAQLVDLVWDDPAGVDQATVETVVSRLRRKLDQPSQRPLLVTRRGVGYGLMDQSD